MPRTRLLAIFTAGLVSLGTLPTGASAQPSAADVQKRMAGHWRLLTFVNFDENGVARDAGYESGRITYDASGNMAAQLMRVNRKPLSQPSTEAERAAAYSGYVAYYGRVTIDTAAAKVTHHVEGSTNPNWVKTDLVRYYAFSEDGSRLMLSIKNAQGRVTGTLTWERIDDHQARRRSRLPRLALIALRLRPYDVDEIAHGLADIDQMKPPAGIGLAVRHHVARNVIRSWIVRVAVHGDLEV